MLAYVETWHILENLRIFRTLTYLKLDTYSEPSQMFKVAFFAKIIKNYNYFSKGLYLRSLTVFRIRLSFNKDSENDLALLYDKYSEPCLLSKIQTYLGLFTFYLRLFTFSHIVAYLEPCVTLAYSEPCHIQNPGIFRTQDIFRTLSRHDLVHSER